MKSALTAFQTLAVVAVRMVLASAAMLPFWSRLPAPIRRPGDRRWLVFLASLYPCVYFACESHTIDLATASQAGAVSAVAPLLVAVGARAGILYLGLAVTLIPVDLHNFAVSRTAAARAAMAINLVPIVAILTGWALLGDALTPIQLVACAVIPGGVLLGQRPQAGGAPDRDLEGVRGRA